MPSKPQPITLRPLTGDDVASVDMRATTTWSDDFPLPVYVRVDHGGESFYMPAWLKSVKTFDVYANGMADGTANRAQRRPNSEVVGQLLEVTARSERGVERTATLYSSPETFDTRYPEGNPHRNEMLSVRARDAGRIMVPGDGGPHDFEARLVPLYGAEVNVRLIAPDVDPEALLAAVKEVLASKGNIVRAQARTVDDLRVNVSVIHRNSDTDYQPVEEVLALNVLEAQVGEFMREVGPVTTTQVRYGATPNVVIGP